MAVDHNNGNGGVDKRLVAFCVPPHLQPCRSHRVEELIPLPHLVAPMDTAVIMKIQVRMGKLWET